MNAEVAPRLPYNGAMMRWARKWRGRTLAEASEKLGVSADRIAAWESNQDTPTVRQARILAAFYDREFLEFFYDEEPAIVEPDLVPDFRLHRLADDPRENREILGIQRWAEMQRINALELYADIHEAPPAFPEGLHAKLGEDVEDVAVLAREALRFPFARQKKLTYKERQDFHDFLRRRMDAIGILVLRENALAHYGVSALCIVQFPLPIIVFSSEAPARSAFTLMHEFAHVILRESAISGPERTLAGSGRERQVERWCDRFAAAFLVPRAEMISLRPLPARPAPTISDDVLSGLAKVFRVSQHAMLIRLVDLKYVRPEYYWGVKRPQYLAEEAKWKSMGIPKLYVSRIWNKVGVLYTGLVLEALGTGRIQPHQAQSLLGVANPNHLSVIRQEFGGA